MSAEFILKVLNWPMSFIERFTTGWAGLLALVWIYFLCIAVFIAGVIIIKLVRSLPAFISWVIRRLGYGKEPSASVFLELVFPSDTTKSAFATEQLHVLLRGYSSRRKWLDRFAGTKKLMQRMLRLYLEPNHSIATIREEMRLAGIVTRKGRPYSKSSVQNMLMNPFYIGTNHFNGRDYPGAQEPIISKDLFSKVQLKMHNGRPMGYKKHNPIFKNIITCGECSCVVTWQRQKGRYYGSCQRLSEACKGRSFLREDKVEELILQKLRKLVSPSPAIVDWVTESMREKYKDRIESHEKLVASIQAQIGRINRMDDVLYDDKLSGDISPEKYEEKHKAFAQQRAELEQQLQKADRPASQRLEQRLVILELSQKAAELYSRKTPEQKRLIITKLFTDLTFDRDSVSVTYTNFARAIADKVQRTHEVLGGTK